MAKKAIKLGPNQTYGMHEYHVAIIFQMMPSPTNTAL